VAHRSRFHRVVGRINLASYGSGDLYVSLSRSKCRGAGKAGDASDQRDPEVAVDLAVVLAAGLVAERVAQAHEQTIRPNPDCARFDHQLIVQQLEGAGLPKSLDPYEAEAKHLLESHWELLRDLADYLFRREMAEPEDVHEFIDHHGTSKQSP
jgi:hypothetical protein